MCEKWCDFEREQILQMNYSRITINKITDFRKKDSGITEIITKFISAIWYGKMW